MINNMNSTDTLPPERDGAKGFGFLYHIFKMDKDENPMPQNKVESLLQYLKNVLTDNTTKNRGRE